MARSKKKRQKANPGEKYSAALFTAAILAALLLPLIVYLVLILGVFHAPNSPWLMLGFVGAFLMGIGFVCLVSICFWHDFGWKVPTALLGGGALMILISALLMFYPPLYALFDQGMVGYVFITIAFLLFSLIFYGLFRATLGSWLQRVKRLSRTHIRKLQKGKRNYWWYEELHREIGLGMLYGMNKLYTVLFPIVAALTLLTGYFRPMSIPICILFVAVDLLTIVMSAFTYFQNTMEEHGTYIVFFKRNSNKRIDSVFIDLILVVFMLVMAYVHVMLTAELWGIELPHI